ncbi:hypothetical protein JTB14_035041 [Gonioctena quinquepunctata]|nr:hypothetical protein JTB14_035041 [Gonioctena quinquepunctata]
MKYFHVPEECVKVNQEETIIQYDEETKLLGDAPSMEENNRDDLQECENHTGEGSNDINDSTKENYDRNMRYQLRDRSEIHAPSKYMNYFMAMSIVSEFSIPESYTEAINSGMVDNWHE